VQRYFAINTGPGGSPVPAGGGAGRSPATATGYLGNVTNTHRNARLREMAQRQKARRGA